MSQDNSRKTIEVDEDVYNRFEERRITTASDTTPAMSPSVFLSALLDTDEAARGVFYNE